MAIPESQLETWSNQGAVATAQATHESIRQALAQSAGLQQWTYEPYLQGSYRNGTNIRGDSDVDVVVQLESSFGYDVAALTAEETAAFHSAYPSATYGWREFRRDVLDALVDYYGSASVKESTCCLKVAGNSGRLPADVVVCLQYRKYLRFRNRDDQSYVEGMRFWTLDGREVINFPKWHYDNGVRKNSDERTGGRYKPVVRMFKNARTYLEDHGRISSSLAPSYFLECFLYNASDSAFYGTWQDRFLSVLDSLLKADWTKMTCQNGIVPLFGLTPEQWSSGSASSLIGALLQLWKDF
jgi:hypothetical protein